MTKEEAKTMTTHPEGSWEEVSDAEFCSEEAGSKVVMKSFNDGSFASWKSEAIKGFIRSEIERAMEEERIDVIKRIYNGLKVSLTPEDREAERSLEILAKSVIRSAASSMGIAIIPVSIDNDDPIETYDWQLSGDSNEKQ